MKISTILDHIDSGHFALPEFQRGYVWNRDQVRGLFDSLYRRHPIGGLLVWATETNAAAHRGDGPTAAGVVKLLLDQQFPLRGRHLQKARRGSIDAGGPAAATHLARFGLAPTLP